MSLIPGILTALTTIFQQDLITAQAGDPMKLRTLQELPLQGDPTQLAPFLAFGPHPKLSKTVRKDIPPEIGGPTWHWSLWAAQVGTPRRPTRSLAYGDIDTLVTRIEETLQKHYDLSNINGAGVLSAGAETISAQDPSIMLVGSNVAIFGGDGEFYGKATMVWRYSFERAANWF